MKNSQVKKEYDYLVLTDFSPASYHALKYAISLAKLIKGNIHVAHITDSALFVKDHNQVAELKEINIEAKKNEKTIRAIIEMIQAEGVNAIPYCSIGNIISEFKELNDVIQPDLVVLGKKGEGHPQLKGKLTSYLMNDYDRSLLILGEDLVFNKNTKISIACNENTFKFYDLPLIFSINHPTKATLKLFHIKSANTPNEKITVPHAWREFSNEIDQNIHIEQSSNVLTGLLHYVTNSNIELLCVGRGRPKSFFQKVFSNGSTISTEVVNKIKTPILIIGTGSN